MATKKKLLQAAAGAGGGAAGLDVSEVFSTYLYDGTGSAQTITNGIDLDGEGGLVWVKSRTTAFDHMLADTETGVQKHLSSNTTVRALGPNSTALTSFNSNGFSIGSLGDYNYSGDDLVSWTFRKAPRFFDCVNWTGDGAAGGQDISHSLGVAPAFIVTKVTSESGNWNCYSAELGIDKILKLNSSAAAAEITGFWNSTPTDTTFNTGGANESGRTYVAYLFAHNDGDGEFGDGTQDIIKCGNWTASSTAAVPVDLGFEPQWVLIKRATGSSSWFLWDTMRGMPVDTGQPYLLPDSSSVESTDTYYLTPTATGFTVRQNALGSNGDTFIYIAIRRGPIAVPTDATEVFGIDANGGTSSGNTGAFTSGFPVDLVLFTQTTGANKEIISRINSTRLITNLSNAENASSRADDLDFMDGFGDGTFGSDYAAWMWKRAPSFFDAVAYTGNSTAGRTISHNLGVAPEMMWVKRRDAASGTGWFVSHKDLTSASYYLNVNSTAAESAYWNAWSSTAPTSSVFSLGNYSDVNLSGGTYIAYLFASLDGISRVGSVTHTFGTTTNVDCGFSSGARFVLMKSSSDTGPWRVWDSTRGIVAGNDPYLHLDDTQAEITNGDLIDPYSSGFAISPNFYSETVIYYAIA